MKTIISGSKDIDNYQIVKDAIKESNFNITKVVSRGSRGVARLGEKYAKENNIEIKLFYPNFSTYGNNTGIMQDIMMINYSYGMIIIWDGLDREIEYMIKYAKKRELLVFEKII